MEYSIALPPRESHTLLNMRLDPLLTGRIDAHPSGVKEIVGSMILFADYYFRNEFGQEEINQEASVEGKDVLEGLLPHNRPSGYSYLQGTLTASLRGELLPIFRRISVVPPEKFEGLSTARIIKQLIRVYLSDTSLQWAFRRMMFLGSLYGLEPDETASLLDGEPVDQGVFDIFNRSFMDDYTAWMSLLGRGGGNQSGSGGEFPINLAIERYKVFR